MKHRFFLLGSLLLVAIVLAACGGSTTNTMPGMNMGTSPTFAGTMGRAPGSTTMTVVQVTETEFYIDASVTSFTPGTSYHFVVKNTGKTAHEFMIMPKAEGAMPDMSMGEMDHMALARIETIAPGVTQTVNYTFLPSAAGSFPRRLRGAFASMADNRNQLFSAPRNERCVRDMSAQQHDRTSRIIPQREREAEKVEATHRYSAPTQRPGWESPAGDGRTEKR